jgi:hypothetical protein
MPYDKEYPILTTSEVNALSTVELHTLTCFNNFVTSDPEGTTPVEPARVENEAVMIYEDAKGKRTMDQERELAVLKAKFATFHEARALPSGVLKVQLLSFKDGFVHVAHPFVKDGPVEFFGRNGGGYYRMPI